jgi:hypothetical protein
MAKAQDRAPQAASSSLQRIWVGHVVQHLSTHDGAHQSVVPLNERIRAFTTICLRLLEYALSCRHLCTGYR